MRWHSTRDRGKGIWFGWRGWLNPGILDLEFRLPTDLWMFHINLAEHESALSLCFGCGLFFFAIGTEWSWLGRILARWTKRPEDTYSNGRTIGISFHDGAAWVSLWEDSMVWKSVDPWWWRFTIHFDDLVFGKSKYEKWELDRGKTEITMPEGKYGAWYTVERRKWSRPRSPLTHEKVDVWFEIPSGIPEWGKGENSWDCDMDATFGIGTHWDGNIHSAAKRIAMRCLENRSRRGSLDDPAYAAWHAEKEVVNANT